MKKMTLHHKLTAINLKGKALSQNDIQKLKKHLRVAFSNNISFILAMLVLSIGVTYRALTLGYDNEHELFKISLYIGLWFGIFIGLMINGNLQRKLFMVFVAISVAASAGLFASMLVVMLVGETTNWIVSINILASSLGSMWVLTYFDEVLKAWDSIATVNEKEFNFIRRSSTLFEELYHFSEKIIAEDRMPLTAEYWAYRDWIKKRAEQNKKNQNDR